MKENQKLLLKNSRRKNWKILLRNMLIRSTICKNPDIKVSQLLKEKDAEVVEFARFEKGEGIEKKEENFAEEVMKQLK